MEKQKSTKMPLKPPTSPTPTVPCLSIKMAIIQYKEKLSV